MSKAHFASRLRTALLGAAVVLSTVLIWSGPASAGIIVGEPIDPGFDLYHTPMGTLELPLPIPPDFFDPGSAPFSGVIMLGGAPGVDTIVQRLAGLSPLEVGGSPGTIPIEIVALHLVSIQPIQVIYPSMPTMPQFWDVFVDLMPPPNSIPGTMMVHHQTANGGTFDMSDLDINVRLTFKEHGNPSHVPAGAPIDLTDILAVLDGFSGTWSHDPPPDDAHNTMFPAGNFYVTDPPVGGDLFDLHWDPAAIPEPRAWLMLGLVVVGIGAVHVTRRLRGSVAIRA
jgi:hypothetical protein